jgi:hypothetical protein
MPKRLLLPFFLLFLANFAHAQGKPSQSNYPANVSPASGAPSGNCPGTNQFYLNTANGNFYTCPAAGSPYVLAGGGPGTGTVTTTGSPATGNMAKFSGSTAITNATAGTDYVIPSGSITGSAGSFTGSLAGDVTGTQAATTVAKVNGVTPGGSCTNQAVTSINASAVPSCSTLTGSFLDIAGTQNDLIYLGAAGVPTDSGVPYTYVSKPVTTVGQTGRWNTGAAAGKGIGMGSTVAPVAGTMYVSQMTLDVPQVIGHATSYMTVGGGTGNVWYVCLFTSNSSAAVWSGSVAATTSSASVVVSATQYTALPGTYYVAYEQTGGTAGTLETYDTGQGLNAILNTNGTSSNYREAFSANSVSAGACPATLGTLSVLSAANTGDVALLLEP